MRDGGRLAAAIEVLQEIETRRRPVQEALKDWGNAHRFAGSGDRVAIGNLVFDALRHKLSYANRMRDSSPRALALATYRFGWGHEFEQLETVLATDHHSPEPLSALEREALATVEAPQRTGYEAADMPQWLFEKFEQNFADEAVAIGQALAQRAPIDLRCNLLKISQEKLSGRLSHLQAETTGLTATALRLAPVTGARKAPHVQAEEGFRKGWFELQDEASQVAASLVGVRPGEQVLDLCAGGGGKSLALAALMGNRGQIYAYDASKLRLAPLYDRMSRAGARNIQVVDPQTGNLKELEGRMDRVMVDAPCTGTGVWRRRPDTKWRVTPNALQGRLQDQQKVLVEAARYVRPGGTLVYATCSLLPEENQHQVAHFLSTHAEFSAMDMQVEWERAFPETKVSPIFSAPGMLTLTPAHTNTDGFFIAKLQRHS
ncbi:RsmB/NOP family class I SAM-dependent RNA methyltransferase [Polycladidibacter hongkongensis]|uniref:RsmB/NOP family class I SAM-dependent RNA methyltransferase n=1 Tax=Polycladidibacter hongkongensis TaxID=1647556 RepID=UPI00083494A9|nr:RsmB/NOP family class I SAM-dependent RNA methyltransferase [Pseudovibrio hongkongensis]